MQLLKNVRLTTTQQQVLVAAASAPTDSVADIPHTPNHKAAVALLTQMGAMTKRGDVYNVTTAGAQLGKYLGLLDDTGNVTDKGQALLPQQDGAADASGGMGGDPMAGGMGGDVPPEDDFGFEEPQQAGGEQPVEEPQQGQEQEELASKLQIMRRMLLNRK